MNKAPNRRLVHFRGGPTEILDGIVVRLFSLLAAER